MGVNIFVSGPIKVTFTVCYKCQDYAGAGVIVLNFLHKNRFNSSLRVYKGITIGIKKQKQAAGQ